MIKKIKSLKIQYSSVIEYVLPLCKIKSKILKTYIMAQPAKPVNDIFSHKVLSMVNVRKSLKNSTSASISLK